MSGLTSALGAAADALDASVDELTRLDSLQGDGDLGRTAGRIAVALRQAVEETSGGHIELLRTAGTKIASAAPSSSGTLIASGFLAASTAVTDASGDQLVAGLTGAMAGIRHRGKAEPGDRTMLDALAPALACLEADPSDLAAAAAAAERGADETRMMQPKVGRARFLADRAVGEPDPGAIMVATALAAALRSTDEARASAGRQAMRSDVAHGRDRPTRQGLPETT